MKELAYRYYCEGWGCGQSIIKAADEKFSLGLKGELLKAASAAGNGFGYGGLCAVPAAVVLIFGYMFDESTFKRLRLQFLDEFNREADVPRTREQALAEMRQFFPALKRWQQK